MPETRPTTAPPATEPVAADATCIEGMSCTQWRRQGFVPTHPEHISGKRVEAEYSRLLQGERLKAQEK